VGMPSSQCRSKLGNGDILNLLADDHLFLGVDINQGRLAFPKPAGEEFFGQAVFEQSHHGPPQWAGPVAWIVPFLHESLFTVILHRERDALLLHAAKHLTQHNFGDVLHLVTAELTEDDDFIETIKELRAEILLEFFIHKGANSVVIGLVDVAAGELEAKTAATFLDHLRSDV